MVTRDAGTIKHVVQCLEESRCPTNMIKLIVICLVRRRTSKKNEQKQRRHS